MVLAVLHLCCVGFAKERPVGASYVGTNPDLTLNAHSVILGVICTVFCRGSCPACRTKSTWCKLQYLHIHCCCTYRSSPPWRDFHKRRRTSTVRQARMRGAWCSTKLAINRDADHPFHDVVLRITSCPYNRLDLKLYTEYHVLNMTASLVPMFRSCLPTLTSSLQFYTDKNVDPWCDGSH